MSQVKLTAFGVSLLGTLCVTVLYLVSAPSTLMRNLEAKALDLRFHLRGEITPRTPVVLVVIDDRSIAELGRWPWSRRRFAEIVQRLQAAGAKVIGIDLLLAEPEDTVERGVLHRLRQTVEASTLPFQDPLRDAIEQVLRPMEPGHNPDLALAAALQDAGNVVLAFSMTVGRLPPPAQPPQVPPPFLTRSAYRTLQSRGSAMLHPLLTGTDVL